MSKKSSTKIEMVFASLNCSQAGANGAQPGHTVFAAL
jgi:hypothetical protein